MGVAATRPREASKMVIVSCFILMMEGSRVNDRLLGRNVKERQDRPDIRNKAVIQKKQKKHQVNVKYC